MGQCHRFMVIQDELIQMAVIPVEQTVQNGGFLQVSIIVIMVEAVLRLHHHPAHQAVILL